MEEIIKISIVEDDIVLSEALSLMIEADNSFELIDVYTNGEDALKGIIEAKPQVVLMDINLPGISGIECIARVKFLQPNILFLIVSSYEDDDKIFDSLKSGASGYILKTEGLKKITSAIKELISGGSPMSASIARKVVQSFNAINNSTNGLQQLTEREVEVLDYIAKGFINKEVAYIMKISMGTVRKHVQHIYEKLHCNTRVEAVNLYLNR
jgi:two-component system, NarL family, response regulator LiaR